jgi:hypothetical protein
MVESSLDSPLEGGGFIYTRRKPSCALRAVGNNEVNYFITTAGHDGLGPETDSKLCVIMNDLPPVSPFDRGGK